MTGSPPQGHNGAFGEGAVATAGALPRTSGARFTFFGMEPVPPRCVVCKEVPISEVPISNIN